VTIEPTSGTSVTRQLDHPRGNPHNPLTDAQVAEKFAALAEPVLSAGAQTKLLDAIWSLDSLARVHELGELGRADLAAHTSVASA
jgi:2-methylcitrate dehydratase PrpD